MAASETRFERAGAVIGWGLIPVIGVMQFVNLRQGLFVPRDDIWSVDLLLFSVVILAGFPWTLRGLRSLSRPIRWALLSFLALAVYALGSALIGPTPIMLGMRIHRIYLVMPIVAAMLALGAAVTTVVAMPARLRRTQLWAASWALLITSYVTWPTHVVDLESLRFSPGMGGAAVIYVALLPTLAVLLSCALDGYHRVLSGVGAALAGIAIILSGSRGGLLCCAVFVGFMLFSQQLHGQALIWVRRVGLATATVLVAIVVFIPEGKHLFSTTDILRETNAKAAWRAWTQSWDAVLLGQGSGRVWPWYSFEAGYFGTMPRLVYTPWGDALPHPHSTVLMVMSELGIVGLALLAAFLVALVWILVRSWKRERGTYFVLASIVAGLPGMMFDTFWFKNLPIAFWCWVVLVSAAGLGVLDGPAAKTAQESAANAAS